MIVSVRRGVGRLIGTVGMELVQWYTLVVSVFAEGVHPERHKGGEKYLSVMLLR